MSATPIPSSDHNPFTGSINSSVDGPGYGAEPDPVQSYRYQQPRAEEDPGKVLGIISLVATLSTFIGFNFMGPVIGIVTGYLARKKSRDAGLADSELGKWGFILGIVFVSLAILGGLLSVLFAGFAGLFSLLGG